MDWTLTFLIILFGILIYMNYKKIIKRSKKDKKNKKVSWSLSQAADSLIHQNPSIDFFDESSNLNGVIVDGNLMNSNIVKYLNKQNESYGSKLYSVNPVKAWIPENPANLDDINSWSAHEIVSQNDPNTRVQEYRENPSEVVGSTVGEMYDNMVDNFRVQWGKFEGLGAYDPTSYYGIDVEPSTNGYTNFATY
jgi:hypothetical protein